MKKTLRTIFMATIASATLLSTTAFAVEPVKNEADKPMVISENPESKEDKSMVISENPENNEAKVTYSHNAIKDTVTKIEKGTDDTYLSVMVGTPEKGVRCNILKTAFVIDNTTGELKSVADIKEGDVITVILDSNAPMTMSIPPMTSGVVGVVMNTDKDAFAEVGIFNDELVNRDNTLQLNMDEKTPILNVKGTKEKLTADSIKNKEVLVIYKETTRSIPAQTTPKAVVLLGEAKPEPREEEKEEEKVETFFGLRDLCTELGFEIKWVANDKPVEIVKGENKILVTLNKNTVIVNGEEVTLKSAPKLENSKMFVTDEYKELLSK